MDTIFINCRNSNRSDPQRLLLNFSDKINLKRSNKYAIKFQNILYMEKYKIAVQRQ